MNAEYIFLLIKEQNFDKIYKIIENKQIFNLNIKDINGNYFIHYVINFNKIDIIKLLLLMKIKKNVNINLDILDIDGRSILYNCIKFNYNELIINLLEYDKLNIGISIVDIKDIIGLTSLHYSIIYNNYEIFIYLLSYNADLYILTNNKNNAFHIILQYKRYNMLLYLLDNKYNFDFINDNNENLLQSSLFIIDFNLQEKLYNVIINNNNINNQNLDGLTLLHQCVLNNSFDLFKLLINNKSIDINIYDFSGNNILHHILYKYNIIFLKYIFDNNIYNFNFNAVNINGDTALHIILNNNNNIDNSIINIIIKQTDINLQDNNKITCLIKIINKDLFNKFKDILVKKQLNIFINNDIYNTIINDKILFNIVIESYYNQLLLFDNNLLNNWEIKCKDNFNSTCKNKIKNNIINNKQSYPNINNINIYNDTGIITNIHFYTGSTLDILFGLIFLYETFKHNKLNIILEYPLTENILYEQNNKNAELEFNNIEILWVYQTIFYPTYFDYEIKKKIISSKYIVISIGIEISNGYHSNILFWDVDNKTIERFEPNGAMYPVGLNYNPELLDKTLEEKFKVFDNNIKYYKPINFLPTIGFQILEILETKFNKNIGDPNGFCAVWCIWWIYNRMQNINISINNIAYELIKYNKFDNISFRSTIREFSKNITSIRDNFIKNYNLTINDWILKKYDKNTLNIIEKHILNIYIY